MKKISWTEIFLLVLSFIVKVKGVCLWNESHKRSMYAVKCTCNQQNQTLVIEADNVEDFTNVHSLEIKGCKNATLLPGIFRKAINLHTIKITETDTLYLDPALTLPIYLQSLHLSQIGSLNQWLAPEPNTALLSSLKSLHHLYFENVTVTSPPASVTSTFIDLPITKVYMVGVYFIGALPQGALEFNERSLSEFNAINCHFGDLHNGSFVLNTSGYANVVDCTFRKVESGAIKFSGQHMAFIGNSFLHLEDPGALLIHGKSKLAFSGNIIKSLGGAGSLELEADMNTYTTIHGNQLPCSHFMNELIKRWYMDFNASGCDASDKSLCFPLQKNYCIRANGKREDLVLQTNGSLYPHKYNGSSHTVSSFGHVCLYLLLLYFYSIWF